VPEWGGLGGFEVAMGIAVFCNEGMVILSPQVQSSMLKPQRFGATLVCMATYFIVNYMAVATAGYYLHFPQPMSEMTLDFDVSRAVYRVAVYLYAMQIAMTYVVVYYVTYSSFESWLESSRYNLSKCHLKIIRVLGVVLSSIVAISIKSFGDYIAFMGAIGNSLGIYLLPNIAFLVLHRRGTLKARPWELVASISIMIFGAITGSISTVASFMSLIGSG